MGTPRTFPMVSTRACARPLLQMPAGPSPPKEDDAWSLDSDSVRRDEDAPVYSGHNLVGGVWWQGWRGGGRCLAMYSCLVVLGLSVLPTLACAPFAHARSLPLPHMRMRTHLQDGQPLLLDGAQGVTGRIIAGLAMALAGKDERVWAGVDAVGGRRRAWPCCALLLSCPVHQPWYRPAGVLGGAGLWLPQAASHTAASQHPCCTQAWCRPLSAPTPTRSTARTPPRPCPCRAPSTRRPSRRPAPTWLPATGPSARCRRVVVDVRGIGRCSAGGVTYA